MNKDLRWRSKVWRIPSVVTGFGENRYEVDEQIGAGGNSVVFSGIDSRVGTDVAIKFLCKTNAIGRERFRREVKLLESVKHENLMPVFDNGLVEGEWEDHRGRLKKAEISFYVMPQAEMSLRELVSSKKEIIKPVIFSQFKGLAEGLSILHEHGIHRDIKPENILILGSQWTLSDFGLFKFLNGEDDEEVTRENEVCAPRFWPSPEVLNKIYFEIDEIDKYSDVFQLASVFWYVLKRKHPLGFPSNTNDSDDPLLDLLNKCLQSNKDSRPSDGKEFYTLINQL